MLRWHNQIPSHALSVWLMHELDLPVVLDDNNYKLTSMHMIAIAKDTILHSSLQT